MAARVTCCNVAVKKVGDEFQSACIMLPRGVKVDFRRLNRIVAPFNEYSRDRYFSAAEFYAERRERNLNFIADIDNILRSGRGGFGNVCATNCSGGIRFCDFVATISLERHGDEGGAIEISLTKFNTKCMLHALRRFAETWADDSSEEYGEDGRHTGLVRENINLPMPPLQ